MANTRGQESPMDFQWENAHGPVSSDSPWRLNNIRSHFADGTPSKTQAPPSTFGSPSKNPFTSSSKNPFTTPSRNPFTTPTKSYNFPNIQPRPPVSTLHKQLFFTPRQPETPTKGDFSEVDSTPGDPMDTESEAPTPDPHLNHILHRNPRTIARALQQSPTRVTGRGEIRRGRDDDRVSKEHRSLRHRRTRSRKAYVYSDDEDDSEDEPDYYDQRRSRSRRRRIRSRSRPRVDDSTALLKPSTADGWRPNDISDWIQIVFNLAILGTCFFYGCAFIWTIQADVRHKVEAETSSLIQSIAQCHKEYVRNRCNPNQVVIGMEEKCNRWELCMNMDPHKVGWAKLSAVTLAEIFNGFAHTLTYKSMLFFFVVVVGSFFVINAAFTLYRSWKIAQQPSYVPMPMQQYGNEWLPATPARPSAIQGTPWATPAAKSVGLNWFPQTPGNDNVAKKLEWN
ncbi:hypothetical protein EX30DRAFT_345053 [Ascodesmis nigricans]|uniref:Brl1/Brr6 domain-containing protein n=1 Tax=Ascodesmis nigricans TaxID=341454 RepID=A0A4S2MHA1_9PEZI|nr:hypothetical protein EX30DRAFT_345053 [Ascodesmis nigricans]